MHVRKIVIPLAAFGLLSVPTSAFAAFVHVVAPGESLSSIAAADGLTVEQLAAANGLPPTAELLAGSQLVIPPQGSGASEGEAATPATVEGDGDHDGDDGASEGEAAATPSVGEQGDGDADGDDGVAGAGTTSSPGSAAEGQSGASAATSQPVGVAAEGSPGGPPYPTAQTVSPEQVASIAAANGVPPSLANAIAYMESGFNNELVSSADARGVMQITPGTWEWIDRELAGAAPLAPASALENVRGGVLLLHSLLQATGGDQALAAAGYYQGLPSVLQNGMYPSTQRYVSDVEALQQRFGGG
jgi:N-acetylmuramoyl-L-alanine amidase